ncbi:hypothetical protein Gogos_017025 [Gossypium gossypioides]|uniref:DUF4283 domain-containing protein n=1 Tax=Gossypium gossypioides TaxID=34282 RepID=A0A7J9B9L9_GOSGO|nr:hypothetical protein [Gossypium gossypioides]
MAEVGNNTAVEIGLANLSLDEGEDEGWRADLSGEEMEEGMDVCAVGSFLTASVIQYHAMNKTLANLWHPHGGVTISDLGEFLEYDTKAVGRGYRGFMRIRVRIDIRGPLKQRKKIILSPKNGICQFGQFQEGQLWGQAIGFERKVMSLNWMQYKGLRKEGFINGDQGGGKRPRKFVFSTISMGMDSEKIVGEHLNARISDLLAGSVGQSSRAL